jgi:hypothetical protein
MAAASGIYAVDDLNMIGASFNRYQYQNVYSSDALAAQYSRSFIVDGSRKASGGLRIRFTEQSFGEHYLPLTELSMDLGTTFDLLPQLSLGVAVTHVASLYQNQGIESEIRTEYFGLSYRPSSEFTIDAAMESSAESSPALHAAVEYALDRHVVVRAGTETGTSTIAGGIGIRYGATRLDFAIVRHPDLGSSLSFGIGYVWPSFEVGQP